MPKKTSAPLPEPLQYLRPFVRWLARLAPDELNEDLDASGLESALRKRLRGLNEDAGAEALSKDRELLESWLKTSGSQHHPAYWVLGYLSLPDLAAQVIRPAEPPSPGPKMTFDPPEGWKMKAVPFWLELKKGKLIGTIGAIDEFSFDRMQRQHEQWVPPPAVQGTWQTQSVGFGDISGKKYVFREVGPTTWKRVDYVLSVPGGYVMAQLNALGADFDETPFESKLHTLRLSALR
jgi:hypothetical protein